ncbi:MAG: SpoIIE family protein phosphatase [Treponema sp.]|jgi:serine phosphatase RsbU (regulator of sigma subunit)|nr:SpoIIE family protein phosphatase [Treponema sp.]
MIKSPLFAAALLLRCLGSLGALSDFYWEEPGIFSSPGGFPVSAYNDRIAVTAWQESDTAGPGGEGGRIRVSLAVKTPGESWRVRPAVAGPYTYAGSEPALLSIAVDSRGRILIAAAASTTRTELLISEDRGESFRIVTLLGGSESQVAPRIFTRSDGGFLLFIARGQDQSLSIFYARSDDGFSWTSFEPFVTRNTLSLNFLPTHAARGPFDYVVFQSFTGDADSAPSFQLFSQFSADRGQTWSAPRLITDFKDPRRNTAAAPGRFDNQRPHLSVQDGRLFLVWERRYSTGSPQIYGAFLGEDGAVSGPVEQINSDDAYCNNPIAFLYRNETTVAWFDNRRGANRVYLAQRDSSGWRNSDLSGSGVEAVFARPVISGGDLLLFWQGGVARSGRRLYILEPDTTAAAPGIMALNFTPGGRNRGDRARITWNIPYDSSGIQGFSYRWSRDPLAEPEKTVNVLGGASFVEETALEDGSWYFSLRAYDRAGNWSPASRIEYIRDTTPPPAAVIIPPELDEEGYLPSNTFSLSWNPPPASDIAGYTWNLEYLGAATPFAAMDDAAFSAAVEERFAPLPTGAPLVGAPPVGAPNLMGTEPIASFTNEDNGVWRFSVSAIDEVGNRGAASDIFFRTRRYVPHTYITSVDASQNEQGILSIRIIGRGFADGGRITRIFLDRDGQAPYDREYFLERGDYQVLSDREIEVLRIEDIEEGVYVIGVDHPLRGHYLTAPLVVVDETGTVKFGDYSLTWEPSWAIRPSRRIPVDMAYLIVIGVMLFAALGLAVSIRGIGSVIAEGAALRNEAAALVIGDLMPQEKKRRLAGIKRQGVGLRVKLAAFTIALVIMVVTLVSVPLYVMMTRTQEETLLRGLWDRSSVLMEGLASSARAYLPSGNVLELGFLPGQSTAIPEARYITITGYNAGAGVFDDFVWATNDPDILQKINTAEFQPGVSRITDVLSSRIEALTEELNGKARVEVDHLSSSIVGLTQEALSLALRSDQDSIRRLDDIQTSIRALETRLTERLAEIGMGHGIGSEPAFSLTYRSGEEHFIFFKPVMYRQGTENIYFRGLIRLEVSIESILGQIGAAQRGILRIILLVALTALALGTVGALALSSMIIRPIKKLVNHVELIRDTEDKAKLEGVDIRVNSQDELAVLGSTINEMTQGLVRAAQAAADLTIGKEVQKKFIPLELDREGNKLTSGARETKDIEFFGYYEGAKGVSGDYFDYQELDGGRYYAIIKCDVAGKGIPAALIMIQVATIFLRYFKAWKPTAEGMRIEEVVYQINDFIESLNFKGRFAAFALALLDTQTGLVRFCNAGDNIVHWFDASLGKMQTLTLPETPATGVLPNVLVESKGGYAVRTLTLDHGDILFLYTDGIEEAKRKFRSDEFREILCTEGPEGSPHANHVAGQGDEELGADRVEAIINAVMNRQVYHLSKHHNPEGEGALQFNFSACQGRVEEAIMAMVSVEKMFRVYKAPGFSGDSRVLVDKKVDGFLKEHFQQYRTYCSQTRDSENPLYMYYTHVNEDPQYDDLTIIGIKRK